MNFNNKLMGIFKLPLFNPELKFHISRRDYIDLTIKRMKFIFKEKIIHNDMWLGQGKEIKFNELCENIGLIGAFDHSLAISISTHMISGNVMFTQSDLIQMDKYHDEVNNMHCIYSMCCSEIANGTNVKNLETTVTYDHKHKKLLLHSPSFGSCKFWIGNALYSASVGVVLARLVVNNIDHGPHWFRVPLRDKDDGILFSGINIIPVGPEGGVHGIQMAAIRFNQVGLPLDAMLQRYSSISSDGVYHSEMDQPQRYINLFETFLQERLILLYMLIKSSAIALDITFKYSQNRIISHEPTCKTLIMEPLFCQRLYPELLKSAAIMIIGKIIVRKFIDSWENKNSYKELQIIASAGKYIGTALGLDVLRQCRLMCGALGFHHYNKIITLQNDAEAALTYAGDNSVMSYQIAKHMVRTQRFNNPMTVPANLAQEVEKKVVADCQHNPLSHAAAQILSYSYGLDLVIQEIQNSDILDDELLLDLINVFSPYLSEIPSPIVPTIERITYLINIISPPPELITAPIANADYTKEFTSKLYTE
ncbi:acyl-CoA dehydrogenase family protein [Yersinia enterocolitica]|uniref:acyl-CoA dehydrogenase family protein n=1 Tax=Yersinia enterocolitica TaxID=630 RepID=UPI001C8D9B7B|nr:acyl-CoA dehydrogenase family protein [Yersinia enterocolitica]MBX9496684.1 acyl-CoA dehydrogenase family protein [Yersinia enterocolitica]